MRGSGVGWRGPGASAEGLSGVTFSSGSLSFYTILPGLASLFPAVSAKGTFLGQSGGDAHEASSAARTIPMVDAEGTPPTHLLCPSFDSSSACRQTWAVKGPRVNTFSFATHRVSITALNPVLVAAVDNT